MRMHAASSWPHDSLPLVLIQKCHLRASIFQNFPGGACPALVSYACWLCFAQPLATHNQKKLHFICVTMPDLENPLENCLWAWIAMHVYLWLCTPPFESLDPPLSSCYSFSYTVLTSVVWEKFTVDTFMWKLFVVKYRYFISWGSYPTKSF